MTIEKASELADLFVGPRPAVVALLLETQHGATRELRARAGQALAALDPDEPGPAPLHNLAVAIARTLLHAVYCHDPAERRRIAGLLESLCREAAE